MRVSLFTREWIEIDAVMLFGTRQPLSPSLRGSGLKLDSTERLIQAGIRLPLYEGVD